jgi:hypothetical protein
MGRPPHARNLTSFGALQTLELRLHRSSDNFSQSEAAALPPQNVEVWAEYACRIMSLLHPASILSLLSEVIGVILQNADFSQRPQACTIILQTSYFNRRGMSV